MVELISPKSKPGQGSQVVMMTVDVQSNIELTSGLITTSIAVA